MKWFEIRWRGKLLLVFLGLLIFGLSTYMVFNRGWSIWIFWLMLLILPLWILSILSISIQVKLGDGRFPGPGGDF